MSPENKKDYPVLLFTLTIFFLILLSFIPADIDLGIIKTRQVDFFKDIKKDSLQGSDELMSFLYDQKNSASLFNLEDLLNISIVPTPAAEPLAGDISQLRYFFDALKNSSSKKVRIAHYGDSAIEGDAITADLRVNMQKIFGGQGAGFLSITSKDTRFRVTTRHTFSDDWQTFSVTEPSTSQNLPGIGGSVSLPNAGSWVKYEVSGIGSSPKSFNVVRLFYKDAKKSGISYRFDNGKENKAELETGSGIKELRLSPEGSARSVIIKASVDQQASFFGVSLESGNGLYIDNFPLRGNSGLSMENIPDDILTGFNNLINYKLIILNFGLNLLSEMSEYSRYEKQMIRVIEKLKKAFPETSILIVGVGDKSMKKGSRFITDPNVTKLIDSQKRIAAASGSAFWDLYKAMGGENSMHQWVNSNPPLASKDYTHVNLEGAKKIADMLSDAILNAYRQYK